MLAPSKPIFHLKNLLINGVERRKPKFSLKKSNFSGRANYQKMISVDLDFSMGHMVLDYI
jgi:hypothetical protein